MINSKIFLKGLKSLIGVRSPAIPLATCFIALGALLKDAGLNIQQSAASSFFTYALPGQLVLAEPRAPTTCVALPRRTCGA